MYPERPSRASWEKVILPNRKTHRAPAQEKWSVPVHGAALLRACQRKESVYPELMCRLWRARLVVLACESCGRSSSETLFFLRQVAKAKARHEPPHLCTSTRLAGLFRREHNLGVQQRSGIGVVSAWCPFGCLEPSGKPDLRFLWKVWNWSDNQTVMVSESFSWILLLSTSVTIGQHAMSKRGSVQM